MKVFACVLAIACLIACVYGQGNVAAAQAAAAGGANPMVGGGRGGLGNLMTYGALFGGMGSDSFRRYTMCNMMFPGSGLCMAAMMQ